MNNIERSGLFTITVSAVVSLAYLSPVHSASAIGHWESTRQTAESHIKIEKEMLIERGAPVDPSTITPTHDSGFVVAGSLGGSAAWATRIDSNGRVVWRHVAPYGSLEEPTAESAYTGAVQLPDDSTVLCGSAVKRPKDSAFLIQSALLTHISNTGSVVTEDLIDPDSAFVGNDIRHCVPSGEGAVAIGLASPQPNGAPSYRMHFIDSAARRIGEHSFPASGELREVLGIGTDTLLVFFDAVRGPGGTSEVTTRLLRLGGAGQALADRTISGAGMLLRKDDMTNAISLYFETYHESQLRTLGVDLSDVAIVNGPYENLLAARAYQLRDGSMVLFGQTEVTLNSYSGSITWLNPRLNDKQMFMFQPLFTNDKVRAVTFAGRWGEFVTARAVHPRGIPGSEVDPTGLMLTIFNIR